ncbi:hypothetical protein [Nitrincola tapanii]|nr:hypothetical protein [Nitrincola tapanii]
MGDYKDIDWSYEQPIDGM